MNNHVAEYATNTCFKFYILISVKQLTNTKPNYVVSCENSFQTQMINDRLLL